MDLGLSDKSALVTGSTIEDAAADLSTAAGCTEIIARIPSLDVLINNLSIFAPTPFDRIDDAKCLRFCETNVMSGVRLT